MSRRYVVRTDEKKVEEEWPENVFLDADGGNREISSEFRIFSYPKITK